MDFFSSGVKGLNTSLSSSYYEEQYPGTVNFIFRLCCKSRARLYGEKAEFSGATAPFVSRQVALEIIKVLNTGLNSKSICLE